MLQEQVTNMHTCWSSVLELLLPAEEAATSFAESMRSGKLPAPIFALPTCSAASAELLRAGSGRCSASILGLPPVSEPAVELVSVAVVATLRSALRRTGSAPTAGAASAPELLAVGEGSETELWLRGRPPWGSGLTLALPFWSAWPCPALASCESCKKMVKAGHKTGSSVTIELVGTTEASATNTQRTAGYITRAVPENCACLQPAWLFCLLWTCCPPQPVEGSQHQPRELMHGLQLQMQPVISCVLMRGSSGG